MRTILSTTLALCALLLAGTPAGASLMQDPAQVAGR